MSGRMSPKGSVSRYWLYAARPGRPVPRDVVERHLVRMADLVGAGVPAAIATLRGEGFAAVVVVRRDDEIGRLEIVRGPAVSPR